MGIPILDILKALKDTERVKWFMLNQKIIEIEVMLESTMGYLNRNKREGQGIMKYSNGCIFEGIWMKDQMFIGQLKLPDGRQNK
jgi:hypothetical protein